MGFLRLALPRFGRVCAWNREKANGIIYDLRLVDIAPNVSNGKNTQSHTYTESCVINYVLVYLNEARINGGADFSENDLCHTNTYTNTNTQIIPFVASCH